MSTIDSMHAALVPGAGLVARYPHVVLLVAEAEPGTGAAHLVDAAREAGASGELPGKQLARRLAELVLRDEAGELPAFAAAASGPDGVGGCVNGDVAAEVAGDDPATLHGKDAATWVDRVISGEVTSVTLRPERGAEPAGGTGGPAYELDGGAVPAAAVTLAGSRAPAASPAREAVAPASEHATTSATSGAEPAAAADDDATDDDATDEVRMDTPPPPPPTIGAEGAPEAEGPEAAVAGAEFQVVALDDLSDIDEREPLPVIEEEEEAGGAATSTTPDAAVEDQVMVQGIVCSRHHLNNPDANYCSVCGVSMVHVTHNLVTGPRPPLGFMVFDDGSTFTLDHDYVLGREPETADGESMRSIPLDDPERTISRVHAEVHLEGWDVKLVDRGSSNGSYVWDQAGQRWHRLEPNVPVMIEPGTHVALGRRTFRYETPHQPV